MLPKSALMMVLSLWALAGGSPSPNDPLVKGARVLVYTVQRGSPTDSARVKRLLADHGLKAEAAPSMPAWDLSPYPNVGSAFAVFGPWLKALRGKARYGAIVFREDGLIFVDLIHSRTGKTAWQAALAPRAADGETEAFSAGVGNGSPGFYEAFLEQQVRRLLAPAPAFPKAVTVAVPDVPGDRNNAVQHALRREVARRGAAVLVAGEALAAARKRFDASNHDPRAAGRPGHEHGAKVWVLGRADRHLHLPGLVWLRLRASLVDTQNGALLYEGTSGGFKAAPIWYLIAALLLLTILLWFCSAWFRGHLARGRRRLCRQIDGEGRKWPTLAGQLRRQWFRDGKQEAALALLDLEKRLAPVIHRLSRLETSPPASFTRNTLKQARHLSKSLAENTAHPGTYLQRVNRSLDRLELDLNMRS